MTVLDEWYSIDALTRMALQGLPSSKSALNRYATRHGWMETPGLCRHRQARGGGLEFHLDLLPQRARLDFEIRYRVVGAADPVGQLRRTVATQAATPQTSREAAPPSPPKRDTPLLMTDRARRERDARLAILAAFDRWMPPPAAPQHVLSPPQDRTRRIESFVRAYNLATLHVEPWVRDVVQVISLRSIYAWSKARAEGEDLGFDRAQAASGHGLLETAERGRVRVFMLALLAQNPLLTADQIRTQVRSEFGDRLRDDKGRSRDIPPLRTFQYSLSRLKRAEKVALTALSNPEKYRSHMAPRGVNTLSHITAPNRLWQIDASPVDALCVDGRSSVYVCLDIATRRAVVLLAKTPRASAVGLLVRKAILAFGVPQEIQTDHGADFTAQETQRLFLNLGIDVHLCAPYSPQQKGHVERMIKTFQHDFATLLPGFIGHNVTDRKAIEERKAFAARGNSDVAETFDVRLTCHELQAKIDEWLEIAYHTRPHSGLKGKSPKQTAQGSPAPIRTVDIRALDMLLLPVPGREGLRTVTARGIKIEHHFYLIRHALPGDRVVVRMDPEDAGRAYCFDAETGVFVDEAVCPSLAGVDPSKVLAEVRQVRADILAEHVGAARQEIRRLTKGKPLVDRMLEVARRDYAAQERATVNITAFPKREIAHETAPLKEARRAAESRAERAAQPAADPVPLTPKETPKQRFARAKALEAVVAHWPANGPPPPITPDAAQWLARYQRSAEYRGHQDMLEAFPAYLEDAYG